MNSVKNELSENNKAEKTIVILIYTTLILAGGAMTANGLTNIIIFLKNMPNVETLTAKQIIHGLIFPHIILLSGFGFIAWGFILLVKQSIIQSRLK